jgi:hypothetical protein
MDSAANVAAITIWSKTSFSALGGEEEHLNLTSPSIGLEAVFGRRGRAAEWTGQFTGKHLATFDQGSPACVWSPFNVIGGVSVFEDTPAPARHYGAEGREINECSVRGCDRRDHSRLTATNGSLINLLTVIAKVSCRSWKLKVGIEDANLLSECDLLSHYCYF